MIAQYYCIERVAGLFCNTARHIHGGPKSKPL